MRSFVLAAVVALFTLPARGESVIMIVNDDWERCSFIIENERDDKVGNYMILRAPRFMSGINAQRRMTGLPVVDFVRVDALARGAT